MVCQQLLLRRKATARMSTHTQLCSASYRRTVISRGLCGRVVSESDDGRGSAVGGRPDLPAGGSENLAPVLDFKVRLQCPDCAATGGIGTPPPGFMFSSDIGSAGVRHGYRPEATGG